MLSRMSVRARLALVVLISLLGYASLVAVAARAIESALQQSYRTALQNVVATGYHALEFFHGEEQSGRMTRAAAQAAAKDYLRGLRYGRNDYFNLFDYRVHSVMHPIHPEFEGKDQSHQHDREGVPFVRIMVGHAATLPERAAFQLTEFPRPGSAEPVAKLQYVRGFDPWQWVLASGVYLDDIDAAVRARLWTFLAIAAGGLLAMAALAYAVAQSLMRQLGGEPAYAAGLLRQVADGNLALDVRADSQVSLLGALDTSLAAVRAMLKGIAGSAGEVEGHSRAISTSAQQVHQASDGQADATRMVAAAVQQLAVSIDQISAGSRETEQNSARAVQLAGDGQRAVDEAAAAMDGLFATIRQAAGRIDALREETGRIGAMAAAIKDIAAQTNLLALNAAIEAARAGEQGRGFAVVADEVRHLAERTARTTVEIEAMIASVQADTEQAVGSIEQAVPQVETGVALAGQAAAALQEIRQGTEATLLRVREVALATGEQSAASAAITRQVDEIAARVDGTQASLRRIVGAVAELERLSAGLTVTIGRFRY